VTVPDLITRLRHQAGLTQAELARRAATSQAAIARYESGAVSPSVATLERIARAAGANLILSSAPSTRTDLSGTRARNLRRHRSEVIEAARRAGATNVRLFGSVARAEDGDGSDIDLLVDFDTARGLLPIVGLAQDLSALLGERVDVSPATLLKPEVAAEALKEAVPL
jgi:predicted nucleotidyltransferase/DNA-binding XRE family transcriptional regulator